MSDFCINGIIIPIYVGHREYILTMAKTKFRLSSFDLSHNPHRGSEVTVGSEEQLHFLKIKC